MNPITITFPSLPENAVKLVTESENGEAVWTRVYSGTYRGLWTDGESYHSWSDLLLHYDSVDVYRREPRTFEKIDVPTPSDLTKFIGKSKRLYNRLAGSELFAPNGRVGNSLTYWRVVDGPLKEVL